MDGQKAFAIKEGSVYELSNGKHSFTVRPASIFARGNSRVYNRMRKSNRKSLPNMAGDAAVISAQGENYQFTETVGEAQCVAIDVYTVGREFVLDPTLEVIELSQEKYQEFKEYFETLRSIPQRCGRQMGWGGGIAVVCAFGLMNAINTGANSVTAWVMVGCIAYGVLLFALGARKRVRG